ncbi:MAG: hypothetical protein M3Z03_11850 [Actinomycetota bacterium]|nr:hypothetical protein [Actinomycetota bacterium]
MDFMDSDAFGGEPTYRRPDPADELDLLRQANRRLVRENDFLRAAVAALGSIEF